MQNYGNILDQIKNIYINLYQCSFIAFVLFLETAKAIFKLLKCSSIKSIRLHEAIPFQLFRVLCFMPIDFLLTSSLSSLFIPDVCHSAPLSRNPLSDDTLNWFSRPKNYFQLLYASLPF